MPHRQGCIDYEQSTFDQELFLSQTESFDFATDLLESKGSENLLYKSQEDFSYFIPLKNQLEISLIDSKINPTTQIINLNVQYQQDISIQFIIDQLKSLKYLEAGSMIFYFCEIQNVFVYVGNDPLQIDYRINCNSGKIMIKYLAIEDQTSQSVSNESATNFDMQTPIKTERQQLQKSSKKNQTERKINEVIDLVLEWRKIQQGDETEKAMSLEQASKQMNISKKTLDDYLLQLRFGKRYGFDFDQFQNDKIGKLRKFVKFHREANGKKREYQKCEQDFLDFLRQYSTQKQYPQTNQFDDVIQEEYESYLNLDVKQDFVKKIDFDIQEYGQEYFFKDDFQYNFQDEMDMEIDKDELNYYQDENIMFETCNQ